MTVRLANALRSGPTGGAGLELSYQLDSQWLLGVGGAYRSVRLRLRDRRPSPNAIGEERAVPIFVHAARSLGRAFLVEVHAGALVGGALRVESSGGDELADHGYNPAPFVGATLSTRF